MFFNMKRQAIDAYTKTLEYLKQLCPTYYTEDVTLLIIAVFYRSISPRSKRLILAEFRKLAKLLRIRIIFIMEAIRIGINLLDVRRIVIYIILYLNLHFLILLQRGG